MMIAIWWAGLAGATVSERGVAAPILLGGWPGYSFPDLSAVAAWLTATPLAEQTIPAGYHDTHDTMANIDLDYGAALAAITIESVARAATEKPPAAPVWDWL